MKKAKEQRTEASTQLNADQPEDTSIRDEDSTNPKLLMLKVPYAGVKGENLIKGLKNTLQRNLPANI